MACGLPYKNAIDNLKHDLSFAVSENIKIDNIKTIEDLKQYNSEIESLKNQYEAIINNWNVMTSTININSSVATTEIYETPFNTKNGLGSILEVAIKFNDEVLDSIDNYRKSVGIYETKQSLYDYVNGIEQKKNNIPIEDKKPSKKKPVQNYAPIRKIEVTDKNSEDFNKEYDDTVTMYVPLITSVVANKPTLTFEGLIASLFNSTNFGSRKLDSHFAMLKDAWNVVIESLEDIEKVDYKDRKITNLQEKEIYEKFYPSEEIIKNFGSVVTPNIKPVSTDTVNDTEINTEVEENPDTTIENPITGEKVKVGLITAPHTKNLYSEVGGKVEAMLGLAHEYDENDNYVTTSNELNVSAKPFVNYSTFHTGATMPLKLNLRYLLKNGGTEIIGVWEDLEAQNLFLGDRKPKRKRITAKEYLASLFPQKTWEDIEEAIMSYEKEGVTENNKWMFVNEQFIKTVPIGVDNTNRQFSTDVNEDTISGGLPDYFWFNTRNVALKGINKENKFEPDTEERQRRIEENRKINLATRKAIIANGVYNVKIKERRRSVENRISENPSGDQNKYNSLRSQFDSVEDFEENASLLFFAGGKLQQESGVPFFKNEEDAKKYIDNYADFIAAAKNEKFLNGRTVLLYKSGVVEEFIGGKKVLKDTYTLGNVTNQHINRQNEYEVLNTALKDFNSWYNSASEQEKNEVSTALKGLLTAEGSQQLSNTVSALRATLKDVLPTNSVLSDTDIAQYEDIKSKAIENIKKIKDNVALSESQKERRIALERNDIEKANKMLNKQGFRQDFKGNVYHGHKPNGQKTEYLKLIPDFSNITFTDFLSAIRNKEVDKIPVISVKEQFLDNLHTNLFFTPVHKELSNGKQEKRYTADAQPVIMFEVSDTEVTIEKKEEKEKTLNRLTTLKETLEKEASVLPEGLKELQENKIAEVSAKIESLKKDVDADTKILEQKGKTQPKSDKEFTRRDYNILIQNIVGRTLSLLPLTDRVDIVDLYRKAEDTALLMIADYKRLGQEDVAVFIEQNLFNILGYNPETNQIFYEDSIREYINAELDISSEEADNINRMLGENLKNYESASYEVDPKDSISAKVKFAMIGISDTRKDAGIAGMQPMLPSKEAFGVIQQALMTAKDNSYEELIKSLENKKNLNPTNLSFYEDIIIRLQEIQDSTPDIMTNIIYQLYQHPVDMKLVLFEKDAQGNLSFEVLDANSKDVKIQERLNWTNNLKINGLIELYGGNKYRLNQEATEILEEDYKNLLASINSEGYFFSEIPMQERLETLTNVLVPLGISLEDVLLQKMANGEEIAGVDVLKEVVSGETPILKYIFENITKIKGEKRELTLDSGVKDAVLYNPIITEVSKINDLIKINSLLQYIPNPVIRVAEKNINVSQQPNRITTEINNIKNSVVESIDKKEAVGEVKDILDTPITSQSLLLNILLDDKKLTQDYFGIFNVSLEPFKQKGEKSDKDSGITTLSDVDRLFIDLAFNFKSEGNITSDWVKTRYGTGLTFRKSYARFSTISDSSQLPYLKSALLNVTEQHLNLATGQFSAELSNLLIDQLVSADIRRIIDYVTMVEESNEVTTDAYYDTGAKFFSSLPLLNSLIVNSTTNNNEKTLLVLELINRIKQEKNSLLTKEDIEDFIQSFLNDYSFEISKELSDTIHSNARETHNLILSQIDEDGNIKASFGDLKGENTMLLIYDHTINTLLQQKEIQQIFAGDIPFYFKTNTIKDSKKAGTLLGNIFPGISFLDVFEYYYGGSKSDIDRFNSLLVQNNINLNNLTVNNKNALIAAFPKLQIAPEFSTEKELSNKYFNEELQELYHAKSVQMFSDVRNNLSKRLKGLISPGNRHVFEATEQEYIQLMVEDIENASTNFLYLIKLYNSELVNNADFMNQAQRFVVLSNTYESSLTENEKAELKSLSALMKNTVPNVYAYAETKSTDAQEYITWKEQLDLLKTRGDISPEVFTALSLKLEKQSVFASDIKNVNTPIPLSLRLSKEEAALFNAQPTKPVYFGVTKVSEGSGHITRRPVYVKSSAFPLLPEFTHGLPSNNLNALRTNIELYQKESGKNVRVSYQSANKVGAVKQAIPINSLYSMDSNKEDLLKAMSASSLILNRQYLLTQQDVPFDHNHNLESNKVDTETRKTQFEKIILGDGISEIAEKVFDSTLFDEALLEDLGIDVEDNKISGEDLANIYKELYKKEQKIKKDKFLSKLGINTVKELNNPSLVTLRKLSKAFSGRLDKKQDTKSLEIVHILEDGTTISDAEYAVLEDKKVVKHSFKIPLIFSPNSRKIESVANSLIDAATINLTLPGHHFIVGSEEGTKVHTKEFSKEDIQSLKNKGLILTSNYDPIVGLKSNQVFMSNKFSAMNIKTGKMEEIDFSQYFIPGTNTIDTNRIPKELLSMFSMRVPTSAHQSGALIEVVGFLPDSMRDLLLVSKDATIQIGEDYDIDHRYSYSYNFIKDINGEYRKLTYSDLQEAENIDSVFELMEEDINILRKKYKKAKEVLWKQIEDFISEDLSPKRNEYWNENKELLFEIQELENILEEKDFHVAVFEEYEIPFYLTEKENVTAIKEKIKELKSYLHPSFLLANDAAIIKDEYSFLSAKLKNLYKSDKSNIIEDWKTLRKAVKKNFLEEKVVENNISSLYQSVFSTEDERVRKLIHRVLSTDFSESTAKVIDNKNKKQSARFNIYSFNTQNQVLKSGAVGKVGIGAHSNGVTLNSILQQLKNKLKFLPIQTVYENGKKVARRQPVSMSFGKMKWDGILGKTVNTLRKYTSIYVMESQNSATDNQKLEIMNRRNENTETMNVLLLLQMANLEDDGIMIKAKAGDKEGQVYSYASLFISQPILIDYVAKIEELSSKIADVKSVKAEARDFILKKYVAANKNLDIDKIMKKVTSEKLFSMLDTGNTNTEEQLAIFNRFLDLQKKSSSLGKLQSFINIEAKGMGTSFLDVIEKTNTLLRMMSFATDKFSTDNSLLIDYDLTTENGESLFKEMIGEPKIVPNGVEVNDEDFIFIATKGGKDYYVKPTTHSGHKIVNSISLGYNIWKSQFPFDTDLFQNVISSLSASLDLSNKTDKEIENFQYEVIDALKDYIYADVQKAFGIETATLSNSLFFNSKENESLASYLQRLKNTKDESGNYKYKDLFEIDLFKNMQFEINDDTFPSLIKTPNSKKSKGENVMAYNQLKSLITSKVKLPNKLDGREMTEEELMKELLIYSLLSNQEKGAVGFRNELPIELFSKYGVDNILRSNSDFESKDLKHKLISVNYYIDRLLPAFTKINSILITSPAEQEFYERQINNINEYAKEQGIDFNVLKIEENTITRVYSENVEFSKDRFVEEFIQHNPLLTPEYDYGEFKTQIENGSGKILASFAGRSYFHIVTPSGTILLFKAVNFIKNDNVVYQQIPIYGAFGFNEYNKQQDKSSLIQKNNPTIEEQKNIIVASEVQDFIEEIENEGLTAAKIFKEATRNPNNRYAALFNMLLPLVSDYNNVEVTLVENLPGAASFDGSVIKLNKSHFKTLGSINEVEDIIVEELMHWATRNALKDVAKFNAITENGVKYEILSKNKEVVKATKNLLDVYNFAIKNYISKHGIKNFEEKINTFIPSKNNNKALAVASEEDLNLYRLSNIHEFLAGIIIKDTAFMKEMYETEYKGESSITALYRKLLDFILAILPGAKQNSVSVQALNSLTNIMMKKVSEKNTVDTQKGSLAEALAAINAAERAAKVKVNFTSQIVNRNNMPTKEDIRNANNKNFKC